MKTSLSVKVRSLLMKVVLFTVLIFNNNDLEKMFDLLELLRTISKLGSVPLKK